MKRVCIVILTLVMLVAALAGCTSGKADWEYVSDKKELVIGITLFEPMNYKENGTLTGFETEFAKAVCEKLGVEPKFVEIDWNSKETELDSKAIDCIWNGMTITDERKENMDISIPYMENKQVMIVNKANADKYLTADALKDAKVVAEAKSAGELVATKDEFFKDAKYTAIESQLKSLLEVKAGTADICLIDYVMATASVGEGTDYADLTYVTKKSFSPEEYGVAVRKDSPEFLKKLNDAIQEVANDGTLLEIAKKYDLEELLLVKAK